MRHEAMRYPESQKGIFFMMNLCISREKPGRVKGTE